MIDDIRSAAGRARAAGQLVRDSLHATPPPAPVPPRPAGRHRPAHALHAVLTVLTGGLWGIVWLLCAWSVREYNRGADKIDELNQERYAAQVERHQQRMESWAK